jgi:hypothetical protein
VVAAQQDLAAREGRDVGQVDQRVLEPHGPGEVARHQHQIVVLHDAAPAFEEGVGVALPGLPEDRHRLRVDG